MPLVHILFTGLIRTPQRLKHSIIEFRKNPIVGRIVLSTWNSELQKFPQIREFLSEQNVEVVEAVEPTSKATGFIHHQVKSLSIGLQKFEASDLVFKTRCDLYIDQHFFSHLIMRHQVWSLAPKGEYALFSKRIWVMYFEATKPFYLGDEAFCGLTKDLRYLAGLENLRKDYNIGTGETHIRRFINPFLKKFPLLYSYLDHASSFAALNDNNRIEKIKSKIRTDFNNIFYYLYIKILFHNFFVDYPKIDVSSVYYDSKNRIRDDLFFSNFNRSNINCDRGGHIFCFEQSVIDKLNNCKVKNSELPELLSRLLRENASYDRLVGHKLTISSYGEKKEAMTRYRIDHSLRKKIHNNRYAALIEEKKNCPFRNTETVCFKNYTLERIRQKVQRN